MKIIKLILVFEILVLASLGTLTLLNVITNEQAVNYGSKGLALVIILGFALLAILKVAGNSPEAPVSSAQNDQKNQGPKF